MKKSQDLSLNQKTIGISTNELTDKRLVEMSKMFGMSKSEMVTFLIDNTTGREIQNKIEEKIMEKEGL